MQNGQGIHPGPTAGGGPGGGGKGGGGGCPGKLGIPGRLGPSLILSARTTAKDWESSGSANAAALAALGGVRL